METMDEASTDTAVPDTKYTAALQSLIMPVKDDVARRRRAFNRLVMLIDNGSGR